MLHGVEMMSAAAEIGSPADKLVQLQSILRDCGSVCIGYSGGVDSVYLARVAVGVLGARHVLAVTGRSASVPQAQAQYARELAMNLGIPHLEAETAELADPEYVANGTRRCYFCKSELWRVLFAIANERGLVTVIDGSNADDAQDYRPGLMATREWQVRSPLLEAGLSKKEIRHASWELGLPTWDQPSSPCLSSRLPYGLAVTPERLRQVERAELELRALGFREFRVRHHGDAARLEFAWPELQRAVELRHGITAAVRGAGFARVLLDVEGYRRGALNEGISLVYLRKT
ncbi:MAG: ATP-dependent sacrificial sulfur transferase LarE [Longimicrobiales bacterium]